MGSGISMNSAAASRTRSEADVDVPTDRATRRLPIVVLALSLLGSGVASYLTYTHYNHDALVCSVGDCGTVQSSDYATIGPIPIAILGLGMYLVVALTAVARVARSGPLSFESWTVASWAMSLAGLLYAAYLTYVELWVIDAVCQWCVASAIITLCIVVSESLLLWRLTSNAGTP